MGPDCFGELKARLDAHVHGGLKGLQAHVCQWLDAEDRRIVNDGVDGGMGVSAKDDAVKYCISHDSPPETQTLRLLPGSRTKSYRSHKIYRDIAFREGFRREKKSGKVWSFAKLGEFFQNQSKSYDT